MVDVCDGYLAAEMYVLVQSDHEQLYRLSHFIRNINTLKFNAMHPPTPLPHNTHTQQQQQARVRPLRLLMLLVM